MQSVTRYGLTVGAMEISMGAATAADPRTDGCRWTRARYRSDRPLRAAEFDELFATSVRQVQCLNGLQARLILRWRALTACLGSAAGRRGDRVLFLRHLHRDHSRR